MDRIAAVAAMRFVDPAQACVSLSLGRGSMQVSERAPVVVAEEGEAAATPASPAAVPLAR